jgi:hypothetical protein
MSAYASILAALQGDAALTAILTGGVYDGMEVADISRQATPAAYDGDSELKPCAIVKPETQAPAGPHPDGSRLYVTIWFYQQNGSTEIDAGRVRAYQLLHRTTLAGNDGLWDVRHANDLLGIEMQALGVPAIMSRYVATVNRG